MEEAVRNKKSRKSLKTRLKTTFWYRTTLEVARLFLNTVHHIQYVYHALFSTFQTEKLVLLPFTDDLGIKYRNAKTGFEVFTFLETLQFLSNKKKVIYFLFIF